ncbi:hypothetical protein PSHT_14765, partial [Puccinia striiformis]
QTLAITITHPYNTSHHQKISKECQPQALQSQQNQTIPTQSQQLQRKIWPNHNQTPKVNNPILPKIHRSLKNEPGEHQDFKGTMTTIVEHLYSIQNKFKGLHSARKTTGDPTIKHFTRDVKAAFEET